MTPVFVIFLFLQKIFWNSNYREQRKQPRDPFFFDFPKRSLSMCHNVFYAQEKLVRQLFLEKKCICSTNSLGLHQENLNKIDSRRDLKKLNAFLCSYKKFIWKSCQNNTPPNNNKIMSIKESPSGNSTYYIRSRPCLRKKITEIINDCT